MLLKATSAPDFVVAPRLDARVQVAARQGAQPRREFLDGAADAMRQVDQERERDQPDSRRQQHIRALDAASQIALVGLFHRAPGIANLTRQPVHGDIAQA
jgi:hypothetical protein